jgi:hypothetical protein
VIDSVVLKLEAGQFKVLDDKCFDGKETKQVNGKFSVTAAFSSQARLSKQQGEYFPRITLPERLDKKADGTKEIIKTLEIQVSLPKLMYGTNLLEVDSADLETIYFKLVLALEKIHIRTTTYDLGKAVLKRVDFSKVIRLPDYLGEARQVLRILANFNYKPHSDFAVKQYNDVSEGMALKFWNNTQGYVIYDKVGEIIANGYTKMEQGLIKEFQQKKQKRNVIKFELSLERKQSLEAVLRRFISTKRHDFTLSDIMGSSDISKAILLEAFDKVYSSSTTGIVTLSQMAENELEQYLLSKDLGVKRHALLHYLVNMTTKIGVAAMWAQMAERMKGGTYDRYKKEVALILTELGQITGNIPNLIGYLRNQHQKFAIYKVKSYDSNVKYC